MKDRSAARRGARVLGRITMAGFVFCLVISAFTLWNTPARTEIEAGYEHQTALLNIGKMAQYNVYLSGLDMNPVALHGRENLLPPKPSDKPKQTWIDLETDTQMTQSAAQHATDRDDPAGPVKPIAPPGGANVTVIGDSVPLGAADVIQETLGSVIVDAVVSRNMGEGAKLVTEYAERGELGEYVVLALFTNPVNLMEEWTNDTMRAIPPGHRVICVTPYGKPYMEETAEMVRRLPLWYDYVTVADWNAAIRDNKKLLAADGIHMKGRDSMQIYANLIAQAIEQGTMKPAKE